MSLTCEIFSVLFIRVHFYIDAFLRLSCFLCRLLDQMHKAMAASVCNLCISDGLVKIYAIGGLSSIWRSWRACCDFFFVLSTKPCTQSIQLHMWISTSTQRKQNKHACQFDWRSSLGFLFVREVSSIEFVIRRDLSNECEEYSVWLCGLYRLRQNALIQNSIL